MSLGGHARTAAAGGGGADWAAAKRVYAKALDVPADARGAFVEAELAGEVEEETRR